METLEQTYTTSGLTFQLLKNLTQKSLIIMDNASYHVALTKDAPRLNASKKNIQQWLRDYQIPFEEYELLDSLRLLLKERVIPFVKSAIVKAAEAEGHQVLFQPPHHSDLQAIELIWAKAKGQVAKQYSNSTSFKEVEERLLEAFSQITSENWEAVIKHIYKNEKEYWETDQLLYDNDTWYTEEENNECNNDKELS